MVPRPYQSATASHCMPHAKGSPEKSNGRHHLVQPLHFDFRSQDNGQERKGFVGVLLRARVPPLGPRFLALLGSSSWTPRCLSDHPSSHCKTQQEPLVSQSSSPH